MRHDHPYFIVPLLDVSIHAPRVGCDVLPEYTCDIGTKFQFTHPVWGATKDYLHLLAIDAFQFTHPVWGATH